MRAYRFETTVPNNSELKLNLQSFLPGEAVEIIILALTDSSDKANLLINSTLPEPKRSTRQQQSKTIIGADERQQALRAIQKGKYAVATQVKSIWPSDAFSASKADEKAHEERRYSL